MTDAAGSTRTPTERRSALAWWLGGLGLLCFVVYLMATAETGPVDPTEASEPMSRATAVFNTAAIVFREGLEAVLIFAAVTASFLGANRARRRPVIAGALGALAATLATWFLVSLLLDLASPLGPRLEAITGFVAVVVLLVVLNWFVHNVYWTGWISKHHRRRQRLLAGTGLAATLGLIGLAGTAVIGVLTFAFQRRLPYRRMLVVTGVMVGFVLVVMIGGTALSFQNLGWLPSHPLPFGIPEWMGAWFEIYPTYETVGAQVVAAGFVIGSYYLARYLRVTRPRRLGEPVAHHPEAPPQAAPEPT